MTPRMNTNVLCLCMSLLTVIDNDDIKLTPTHKQSIIIISHLSNIFTYIERHQNVVNQTMNRYIIYT